MAGPQLLPEDPPSPLQSTRHREPPWSEHKYDISKDFLGRPGRPAGLRHRLPGARACSASRKGYGLSAKDALLPRQGQEGRNWPGVGEFGGWRTHPGHPGGCEVLVTQALGKEGLDPPE